MYSVVIEELVERCNVVGSAVCRDEVSSVDSDCEMRWASGVVCGTVAVEERSVAVV